MTSMEFANKVISLPAEKQNAFFESLKKELSKEDWETMVRFISLHSMFMNADKYEAVKNAVRDQICEEFYGHTVEKARSVKEDAVLIGMYSNSIL